MDTDVLTTSETTSVTVRTLSSIRQLADSPTTSDRKYFSVRKSAFLVGDKDKPRRGLKELKVEIREGKIQYKHKLEQQLREGGQNSLKHDGDYKRI